MEEEVERELVSEGIASFATIFYAGIRFQSGPPAFGEAGFEAATSPPKPKDGRAMASIEPARSGFIGAAQSPRNTK